MESKVKRIGVLTSGGDAPGMNAAIRAVVRTAAYLGIDCIGIRRGYSGLIKADMFPMQPRDVTGLTDRGGCLLFSGALRSVTEIHSRDARADSAGAYENDLLARLFEIGKDLHDLVDTAKIQLARIVC